MFAGTDLSLEEVSEDTMLCGSALALTGDFGLAADAEDLTEFTCSEACPPPLRGAKRTIPTSAEID